MKTKVRQDQESRGATHRLRKHSVTSVSGLRPPELTEVNHDALSVFFTLYFGHKLWVDELSPNLVFSKGMNEPKGRNARVQNACLTARNLGLGAQPQQSSHGQTQA